MGTCALSQKVPSFEIASEFSTPSVGNGAAICFSGGGLLSLSVGASFTSGVLAALGKYRGLDMKQPGLLERSRMFQDFGTVVSISGGSWFVPALAYSEQFVKHVEDTAIAPETAAAIADAGWISHIVKLGEESEMKQGSDTLKFWDEVLAEVGKIFGFGNLGLILGDAKFLARTGLTWQNVVKRILEALGVPSRSTLGSPVQSWATGKIWLAGTSTVAPTDHNVTLYASPGLELRYKFSGGLPANPKRKYLPTRFSIQFGEGKASSAPVPFTSETALAPWAVLEHSDAQDPCLCGPQRTCVSEPIVKAFEKMTSSAGNLPVVGVAASSSAFAGMTLMYPLAEAIQTAVDAELGVFVAPGAEASDAFGEVRSIIKGLNAGTLNADQALEDLASKAVFSSIDGGMVDNTGIVHAVATGSTEVVVVETLNNQLAGLLGIQASSMLFSLFANPEKTEAFLPRLASLVPYSNEHFQIFEEEAIDIEVEYNKLSTLQPPDSAKWTSLVSIRVGTLQATTIRQQFFNVSPGRRITIHVVSIDANLNIAELADLPSYGNLMQEVVNAFVAPVNADVVRDQVLSRMLGI